MENRPNPYQHPSHAHAAPTPPAASSGSGWFIALGAGIGAFLGVVVVCGGLGTYFVVAMQRQLESLTAGFDRAHDVAVTLTSPPQATQGEEITLQMVVENQGTSPRVIIGLMSYNDEIRFVSARPAPSEPPTDDFLNYHITLDPGQQHTFEIDVEALDPGRHRINIDADFENGQYAEGFADLEILPAPGATPPGNAAPPTTAPRQ